MLSFVGKHQCFKCDAATGSQWREQAMAWCGRLKASPAAAFWIRGKRSKQKQVRRQYKGKSRKLKNRTRISKAW